MIIASSFGPYTGVSTVLLVLLPSITAFIVKNRFCLSYRILAVLMAYTVAFVIAIDLGAREHDFAIYDSVEFLRYETVTHFGDPVGFYLRQALVYFFLIAPIVCGALIVACPRLTRKYCHIPILFLWIALSGLTVYWDSLELFLIAAAYFVTWSLMKWPYRQEKAEQISDGNAVNPLGVERDP